MIRDEDLKSSVDYSEGQKRAACKGQNIVIEAKDKLAGKFASENHAGPKDVADFMDLEDEESIEMTKRDAYEQVQALLYLI